MEKKPNLFIVGAPKCGTTTLFDLLEGSEEIYCPKEKEIHYFSRNLVSKNYYNTRTPSTENEYLKIYKSAGKQKYLGDFSPSYLYSKEALEAIHNFNPSSKIIIILRDPIERSISHYLMDKSKGFVDLQLGTVIKNKESSEHYYQYVELSKYSKYIEAVQGIFRKNDILILKLENLNKNFDETSKKIFDFLETPPPKNKIKKTTSNQYFEPRHKIISILRKISAFHRIYSALPKPIKRLALRFTTNKKAKKPAFLDEKQLLTSILINERNYFESIPD